MTNPDLLPQSTDREDPPEAAQFMAAVVLARLAGFVFVVLVAALWALLTNPGT